MTNEITKSHVDLHEYNGLLFEISVSELIMHVLRAAAVSVAPRDAMLATCVLFSAVK